MRCNTILEAQSIIKAYVVRAVSQEFGIPDLVPQLQGADWNDLQDDLVKLISKKVTAPQLARALVKASGLCGGGLKIPNEFTAKQYANAYR
jgi:hypothetical protein